MSMLIRPIEILGIGYTYVVTWSVLKKYLTQFHCKSEMYFIYILVAFPSNLETDYDPDYFDS